MDGVLMVLLYFVVFIGISLAGNKLYKALNKKIKESRSGWSLAGFSLLLLMACALLFIGGLYIFIELYAFLAKPKL